MGRNYPRPMDFWTALGIIIGLVGLLFGLEQRRKRKQTEALDKEKVAILRELLRDFYSRNPQLWKDIINARKDYAEKKGIDLQSFLEK